MLANRDATTSFAKDAYATSSRSKAQTRLLPAHSAAPRARTLRATRTGPGNQGREMEVPSPHQRGQISEQHQVGSANAGLHSRLTTNLTDLLRLCRLARLSLEVGKATMTHLPPTPSSPFFSPELPVLTLHILCKIIFSFLSVAALIDPSDESICALLLLLSSSRDSAIDSYLCHHLSLSFYEQ
jgi:hypothetical protein